MNRKDREIPISRVGRKLYNQKVKLTYKTFVKLTIFIWTLLLVLCPTIPFIYILNNLQSSIIYELLTTIPLVMGIELITAPILAFITNALLISTRKVLFYEHEEIYEVNKKIAALKYKNEEGQVTLTKEQVKELGILPTITQTPPQPRKSLVASQSPELLGHGSRVRKQDIKK